MRDEMFKWKRLRPVKIFESKEPLNSLMPKLVDESRISESLSTLFSLPIRAFLVPKFLSVVAKSLIFFPRIVWWNSLLFSFEKGIWSLEHSIQNHWVLSFLNKSYVCEFILLHFMCTQMSHWIVLWLPTAAFVHNLDHLLNGFGS